MEVFELGIYIGLLIAVFMLGFGCGMAFGFRETKQSK